MIGLGSGAGLVIVTLLGVIFWMVKKKKTPPPPEVGYIEKNDVYGRYSLL